IPAPPAPSPANPAPAVPGPPSAVAATPPPANAPGEPAERSPLEDTGAGARAVRGAPPPGSPGGPLAMLWPSPDGAAAPSTPGDPQAARSGRAASPAPGSSPAPLPPGAERSLVRVTSLDAGARAPQGRPRGGFGFVVDPRGYVLTHDRIAEGEGMLQVTLADGRRLAVRQVWRDRLAGVALLKVDVDGVPALPLGSSAELRVGDRAIALAAPPGSRATPRWVTIRATGAAVGGDLAFDIPLDPASAGTPLLDPRGRVVGIAATDPGASDGGAGGRAIPIDRVKPLLRRTRAGGTIEAVSPVETFR